jgi:hypothetical protein
MQVKSASHFWLGRSAWKSRSSPRRFTRTGGVHRLDVGDDRALTIILRQTSAPGPGPQPVHSHQPLDAVKAAGEALGQQIVPNPARSIGAVTASEALGDLFQQPFIVELMGAGRPAQPSMEPGARHLQHLAKPSDRPDVAVLRDEGELHVDSLAKNAATFFEASHAPP